MSPTMTLNVLVVDPKRETPTDWRNSLSQALGETVVREASDGKAALLELERQPAELIIADLETPGFDGGELLEALRSQRDADHQRVVALSRRITPELLAHYKADPGVWFVQKPAAPGEIADLAEHLLKN